MLQLPKIIQGGMGAGVSDWRLAQAVSRTGQLGVVSGTALDVILARRLQDGDPGGNMCRALDAFPLPEIAEKVWQTYYVAGGKKKSESYRAVPIHRQINTPELNELVMVANFAEVFLAREGHPNPVGINYLEKIQRPFLASVYGAMLAGVDVVLMGAGIPLKVPGALDALSRHEPATYPLAVAGAREGEDCFLTFVPQDYLKTALPLLRRPLFFSIISSNALATTMVRRANGKVDGFIIEGPSAGGHNAPPRGKLTLNQRGEAIYSERDRVDIEKVREIGLPFWLAGGYGTPEMLSDALSQGAAGIQVGTAFAFCAESGLREDYKAALLQKVVAGEASVFTDPVSSPTGFPFKAAQLEDTLSELDIYIERPRICDIGLLAEAYRNEHGEIGYRCPAEPSTTYLAKGGKVEDTVGRKCLCNALLANIGQQQVRAGKHVEVGLVTTGDDLIGIGRFLAEGESSYSASDVISTLLKYCDVKPPAYPQNAQVHENIPEINVEAMSGLPHRI